MNVTPSKRCRRRLRSLVGGAARNVPFFQSAWKRLGADFLGLPVDELLRQLPLTQKDQVLRSDVANRLDRRYPISKLRMDSTSGSSGQPIAVPVNPRYVLSRNLRFLRGLLSVGFRPGNKMMMVSGYRSYRTGALRWYRASLRESSEEILRTYERLKPDVLYGCLTPLTLLADQALKRRQFLHWPRLVISTGEGMSPGARQNLQDAFQAPVADFYGSTEMGLVAWLAPDKSTYQTADDSVLIELLPTQTEDLFELVLTNLELKVCPFVRYKTGDLARIENIDGYARITGFVGRQLDALVSADGGLISPYLVTHAMEAISGLRRYQLVQTELTEFDAVLEASEPDRERISREVQESLRGVMGTRVSVRIEYVGQIALDGLRKLRPVRSEVAR